MDQEIFDYVSPTQNIEYYIQSGEPNQLLKYLQQQRSHFLDSNLFFSFKQKDQSKSSQNRSTLLEKKQFQYQNEIVEVFESFLTLAFKLSDQMNIDEYLSCRILKYIIDINSTRDESELLSIAEEFIYEKRSTYLMVLREILMNIHSSDNSIEKVKFNILEEYLSELLTQQQDDRNILKILFKVFQDKIKDINVPVNQKEYLYRIKECIQITECLFLISFHFSLNQENLLQFIKTIKQLGTLYQNQPQDSLLKSNLFQMLYILLFSVFSIFDNINVQLYDPIAKRHSTNQIELKGNQSLLDELTFRSNSPSTGTNENNTFLVPILSSFYYLYQQTNNDNPQEEQRRASQLFSRDSSAYKILLEIVSSQSFKSSTLSTFYSFLIDTYSCKYIKYIPKDSTAKMTNLNLVNEFNNVLAIIYDNNNINSKEFWRIGSEINYFRDSWFRIHDQLIISSFKLMSSLVRCNTNDVFNLFTLDGQFTWIRLFQHLQSYTASLTGTANTISPNDTEALIAILGLFSKLIENSLAISQMFLRTGPLMTLIFQFVFSQVDAKLKTMALRVITSFANYQIFVPDIWKLVNETKLFTTGLKMESEIGDYPFTQQSLELLYKLLIHSSTSYFDPSNAEGSLALKTCIDQCIELFNSINNKSFNDFQDKWKFTLDILSIFEFSLNQFNLSIKQFVLNKKNAIYPLYIELTRGSRTLLTMIRLIEICNKWTVEKSNNADDQIHMDTFNNVIIKCLDILLLLSDNTIYDTEDAKSLIITFSTMRSNSPIISIASLVDHEVPAISIRSLRLIYSFENYTGLISTVFLNYSNPKSLLDKFIKMMEFTEPIYEDTTGPYYEQEIKFIKYASNSFQWTLSQLILLCLETAPTNTYTLAHFLLGCSSNFDLSLDFQENTKSCLTVMLKKVLIPDFINRYPHLLDNYHEIIYKLASNSVTYKPTIKFVPISYYQDSLILIRRAILSCGPNNRKRESLISSLASIFKSLSIVVQNSYTIELKNFLSGFIFPSLSNGNNTSMIGMSLSSASQIHILSLYNVMEFQVDEIAKPKIFSIYPQLEQQVLQPYQRASSKQLLIDIPLLKQQLENDSNRFVNNLELERELDECSNWNVSTLLVNSRIRALEGWKAFSNVALLQNSGIVENVDETLLLTLLQRLVVDFSNEKLPIESIFSIGYTILTILYIIGIKKDSILSPSSSLFSLENSADNFNENLLEQKIKGIFEGLLSTVLKSPHQSIRGIAYTCISQYLTLSNPRSSDNLLQNNSNMDENSIKPIEYLNITLLTKIKDKFIKILSSDCNSFTTSGWKITALCCLQSILPLDTLCGHRSLKYLQNKGFIANIINETTSKFLSENWEYIESKDLCVYEAQMSLLLKISQQPDGSHILMNNNIISSIVKSPFLGYIPTDQLGDKFSSILIPILRLFSSLCLNHDDRSNVCQQVYDFILNHSDLFIVILQDSHPIITSTTLSVLKLTVFLFSQIGDYPLIKKIDQQQQPQQQQKFNRFHYSILNLLMKYSTPKKLIESATPENQEEELLLSKNEFIVETNSSNGNNNGLNSLMKINSTGNNNNTTKKKNLFQVLIKEQIFSLSHDLFLYCRKVSILPNSQFGIVCFSSNLSFSSMTTNSAPTGKSIPSLDVAIHCLVDNVIHYSQYNSQLASFETLLSQVDQLSNVQCHDILQSGSVDHSIDEYTLSPQQRNDMITTILQQKIKSITIESTLLLENIEILLVLIVTHSFYYCNSITNLFQQQNLNNFTYSTQMTDLKRNNNTTNNQQQNKNDIFLASQSNQRGGNNGFVSSMFSLFKGSAIKTPSNNNSNNNNNNSTIISNSSSKYSNPTSLSLAALNNNNNSNNLNNIPSSELSPMETNEFLSKLKTCIFDRELSQMGGIRLYDAISTIEKSSLIQLILKKLKDLIK
ncbi:hypothetical protein CYY_001906 [Polysphondylium violaceum]|uniref:Uncharacterized protein n=1 Tax=Polysphondylium violaceum TaxID=133409 RepID=A0A8J4Q2F9_9MYCE|nr:hypothetical protein CYY_001906 [Polysphondylium violaceum]